MNANLPLEELFQKVYRIFAASFGKAALFASERKSKKKVSKEKLKRKSDQSIA